MPAPATRSRRLALAIASLAALSAGSASGADLQAFSETEELKDYPTRWRAVMDLFDAPGVSVAVVKDGRPYATWSAGMRDTEESLIDQHTGFYVASMTKVYLAAGICRLADEGRLSLDDRVKQHLPQMELPDEEIESKLTISDLLCHRYGINSSPAVILDAYTGDITDERYFFWLANAGEVSGEVRYTNVHFTLLGRVIEAVTGQSWRDYLDEAIFEPAGMHRTTGYASELYGWENSATPLERPMGGAFVRAELVKDDSVMHAAGGMGTTAHDAARWMSMQMNGGEIDGERIVSKAMIEQSHTVQAALPEPGGTIRITEGFGLGWMLGSFNGMPLAMHGGGYLGTSTYFAMLPDDGVGVVILINGGGPARMLGDIIAIDMLCELTGTEPAWDVYERSIERATQHKALRGPFQGDKGGGPFPVSVLSLDRSAYVGRYSNPMLGDVRVVEDAETIRVDVGIVRSRFQGGEAGSDRFMFDGPVFDGTSGRFELEGGRVARVVMTVEELGELVFERTE